MIAWAKALGKSDVADILQKNLEQEYAADQRLSALAESALNRQTA